MTNARPNEVAGTGAVTSMPSCGHVQGPAPQRQHASCRTLPVAVIDPDPDQPRRRFRAADLAELAASMQANGLAVPILVRPVADRYRIVHGERRWRAAMSLGWAEIPAEIRDVDEETLQWWQLAEHLNRADLSCVEGARAYCRLLDDGVSRVTCHVSRSPAGSGATARTSARRSHQPRPPSRGGGDGPRGGLPRPAVHLTAGGTRSRGSCSCRGAPGGGPMTAPTADPETRRRVRRTPGAHHGPHRPAPPSWRAPAGSASSPAGACSPVPLCPSGQHRRSAQGRRTPGARGRPSAVDRPATGPRRDLRPLGRPHGARPVPGRRTPPTSGALARAPAGLLRRPLVADRPGPAVQ